MTIHTHQTAPTQFVEAKGIRFAYRRFGKAGGVQREGSYEYLKTIMQPTLVINGDNDVIIYSINSWILQQNIPNAQLIIYPDANHGSQYQYPQRFVRHVSDFLSE
jgi:pimeloyl-ACP methyl ester carboxylesterase